GIPEHVCDVPSIDNSPPLDVSKDRFEDFSQSNEEFYSTDDDSFSLDNIDNVEALPPDSELVSSEVMEIVIPEVGRIKASNDNPIPSYDPIISGTPPNLTPSRESEFFSEVDAFLAVEDEFTSSQFPKSDLDPEGDMLLFESFLNDQLKEERVAKAQNWKLPVCYDDDDDEERSDSLDDNIISGLPPFSAITPNEPVLSTEEPDNSLSMGDEHLDTIPATKSDEFIKSGVENPIPIPNQFEDFSESNEEFSSIDDDSFSIENIDYVKASPPDSELVSSEVVEIVLPEVGGIDDDILLTIKDDILREKLLNVNLLIAKIKALNANPTPSSDCKIKSFSTSLNSLLEETNTFDNSLPEFETFFFDVEEISSGSERIPKKDKMGSKPDKKDKQLMPSFNSIVRAFASLGHDLALESGAYLDPEQLAFLADNGDTIIPSQESQEIPTPVAFQSDDLDAFDSDCDDVPSAKAVLMANLSSYESDILSEKTKILVVQSTSSSTQQDELLMSVIEEMSSQVATYNKKTTLDYQNPFYLSQARKKVTALFDGNTIIKTHVALFVTDTEETLKLAEEGRIRSWVEHIKGAFEKDVKTFAQTLKEYFRMFKHGLNKELKEMKSVFNQMETDVAKCSVDKKYYEIEKKELSRDNNRLLEHIICQEVLNIVMHANDHSDNMLHANNNSLEHDNSALEMLKHENDRLIELLISQDLVHTTANSLASINDYKSIEQSFLDEYEENLKLQSELDQKNDMTEKAVYNEL
nr:hypothetical protein [Tanacetum cinerariifolium]